MKKVFLLLILCTTVLTTHAQRVNRNYNERSISDILIELNRLTDRYKIIFIYNELEDFTITRRIDNRTIPEAIADCIGFYPIRMEVQDSLITVECTQKGKQRVVGRVIDHHNKPVAYANVALLSPADSSLINGGVCNESGRFVIPSNSADAILRVSFVGYKTLYRRIHDYQAGTLRLEEDRYTIKGVEVKGHKTVVKNDADRLQYLVKNDDFAKGMNGMEVMKRVPLVRVKDDDATIIGKEATHFMLDGHELPDQMVRSKLRSMKAEDIERIEVITIPPSKYKAEGNAGYINIVTRRDQTLGVNGNVFTFFRMNDKGKPSAGVAPTLNYIGKKVEASATIDYDHTDGINTRQAYYDFNDGHTRESDTQHSFIWNWWTVNGLVKYRPTKRIELGATASGYIPHTREWMDDVTTEYGKTDHTRAHTPHVHSRNISTEVYAEVKLDTMGRKVLLTYDHLTNTENSNRISTTQGEESDFIIDSKGESNYHIDEWKLDFELPYKWASIETGIGYIDINNSTVSDNSFGHAGQQDGTRDYSKFRYREQTAAAYVSAFRQIGAKLSVKAGVRMERTWLSGRQVMTNEKHNDNYTHLYPTLLSSWRINSHNTLGAKFSMGISRPDFYSLNPFRYYTTPTQYYSGNPYLQPTTTTNMELNYNTSWGLYAVLYESHAHDAATGVPYFSDGVEHTSYYNCLSTDKAGLYASWRHTFFGWWETMIGAELFYQHGKADTAYPQMKSYHGWSEKLELEQSLFLNKKKTLQLDFYYTHFFPYYSGMSASKFRTSVYLDCILRYRLLNDRLRLSVGISDPFNQDIARYTSYYSDMTTYRVNNVHRAKFFINATWTFGGKKVRQVWHQSKATQAGRAGKGGN